MQRPSHQTLQASTPPALIRAKQSPAQSSATTAALPDQRASWPRIVRQRPWRELCRYAPMAIVRSGPAKMAWRVAQQSRFLLAVAQRRVPPAFAARSRRMVRRRGRRRRAQRCMRLAVGIRCWRWGPSSTGLGRAALDGLRRPTAPVQVQSRGPLATQWRLSTVTKLDLGRSPPWVGNKTATLAKRTASPPQ